MSRRASQSTRERTTVSVALCTHNGERFVVEQLESILSQTVPPDEIVLSDDASTDGTVSLAADVVRRAVQGGAALNFTVLANEHPLGVTGNFAQAIGSCSGSIIVLSDQDDAWRPDRIERALGAFAARDDLLVVHGDATLVDAVGASLNSTLFEALEVRRGDLDAVHAGNGFDVLLRRNIVTGATVALRSPLAALAMPFPSAWVHDEWLAIVGSAVGGLDVLEEQLIDYRQHSDNQIGVAKLGLRGKFGRMREPGERRNARLLERAAQLVARFEAMGAAIPATRLVLVKRKFEHETVRSALPINRLRRFPGVFKEVLTGRYGQFGRGLSDAVRDLIQPR